MSKKATLKMWQGRGNDMEASKASKKIDEAVALLAEKKKMLDEETGSKTIEQLLKEEKKVEKKVAKLEAKVDKQEAEEAVAKAAVEARMSSGGAGAPSSLDPEISDDRPF